MNSTATRFTLNEIVWFCLQNGRKAFGNDDTEQIMRAILRADAENKLYVVSDDKGICGVGAATIYDDVIYVHFLVCQRNGFKTFLDFAHKRFPGREIRGERNNKLKIYWRT